MNEARMGCGMGTIGWRQDVLKESGDNVANCSSFDMESLDWSRGRTHFGE